jgi:hypothetical protein
MIPTISRLHIIGLANLESRDDNVHCVDHDIESPVFKMPSKCTKRLALWLSAVTEPIPWGKHKFVLGACVESNSDLVIKYESYFPYFEWVQRYPNKSLISTMISTNRRVPRVGRLWANQFPLLIY